MKFCFITCLNLLLFHNPLGAQWRIINTGFSFDIQRITFTDSLHSWAMGYHGNIIHTSDGGETWIKQVLPADTFNLREICLLNVNVGYIIGENGLILGTKDGGRTWLQQESGANKHYLMGLSFIDENTGWVTGEMDDGTKRGGILLHTTSGGVKWDTLSDRSDMILYYDVKFADKNNGVVIGSYGFDNCTPIKVYRTYDGGKHLTEISEFSGAHTRYLFMNNIDTLWTGLFGFAKSFDGGFTWDASYNIQIEDSVFTLPMFINFLQINGKTGWAIVLFYSQTLSTVLYCTDDYAFTWKIVSVPEDFYPFCITSASQYLFVGGKNGKIITNKLTPVDINEEKTKQYTFNLLQNYPNPFNPETQIKYSLKEDAFVTLKIFDILGNEIATLVNEPMNQGIHSVNFSAEGGSASGGNKLRLSSRVYIYQLQANNYIASRKMIITK